MNDGDSPANVAAAIIDVTRPRSVRARELAVIVVMLSSLV